jgi:hypothetical protein
MFRVKWHHDASRYLVVYFSEIENLDELNQETEKDRQEVQKTWQKHHQKRKHIRKIL